MKASTEERAAWDAYAAGFARIQHPSEKAAAEFADAMLVERRARFGDQSEALPPKGPKPKPEPLPPIPPIPCRGCDGTGSVEACFGLMRTACTSCDGTGWRA